MSFSSCIGDFGVLNEEKKDFCLNWKSHNASFTPTSQYVDAYNAFKYTKYSKISSYPMSARYGSYFGGSYLYAMNGNVGNIISNFTLLEENNWLDKQTRAVFVEFNVYNPNVNLFTYCYLLIEFLPTGSLVVSSRLSPVGLFDTKDGIFSESIF
jgi:hypothetical protein